MEPEAVGLTVVCPRCHEQFLAIEEAALVVKPSSVSRRSEPLGPARQQVRTPQRARRTAEPVGAPGSPDPHDSPIAPTGGLPVSVLIGFALLPFAIPLLWLIGPHLLTQPPALSLAAPAALALSASILCLSVVFTVDWTPSTRIKGVLMLVGLSYFAGLSLYFLKKEMVDRAKEFLSPPEKQYEFKAPKGPYHVRLPVNPQEVQEVKVQPLAGWKLSCYQTHHEPLVASPVSYLFGSGPDTMPKSENWFEEIGKAVVADAGDAPVSPPSGVKSVDGHSGQRWIVELPNADRLVEVYRVNGTVYYLSIESERLSPDDPRAKTFFNSFQIGPRAKDEK